MRSTLDQIETRLRNFIEGSTLFLPEGYRKHQLAHRIVEAIQSALEEHNGFVSAPGVYTIFLNPVNLNIWQSNQSLFESLAAVLQEASVEAGLLLSSPPILRLSGDPDLPESEIRVAAEMTVSTSTGSTHIIEIKNTKELKESVDQRPLNAFLIIDGNQTFPLRQAVINIGRRMENHLVINDARISRSHAQLRAVRGHYVLFDLNSTGGTYVNSQRITQHQLRPGDVISLAGYAMIYGEDNPLNPGDTGPSTASYPVEK